MMNKKFLTMMFSLLLAVGWTNGASAQKLANSTATENLRHSMQMESETNRSPYGSNDTVGFDRSLFKGRRDNFSNSCFRDYGSGDFRGRDNVRA